MDRDEDFLDGEEVDDATIDRFIERIIGIRDRLGRRDYTLIDYNWALSSTNELLLTGKSENINNYRKKLNRQDFYSRKKLFRE